MFGIDRQVYYRKIKRRFNKQNQARLVVDMVLEIRQQMPRIGARKLYYLLGNNLKTLKIGRDKFIDILRANHLLIVPKRSYHITTNSHHRFRKYNNQLLEIVYKHQEEVIEQDGFEYVQRVSEIIKLYELDVEKIVESIGYIGTSKYFLPASAE